MYDQFFNTNRKMTSYTNKPPSCLVPINSISTGKRKLTTWILGILYGSFIAIFVLISSPVYVYRKVIILLAQVFRPNFGDILSGQSAVFVADYLAKTPPRSNLVSVLVFDGRLTLDEVTALVMKNWSKLENFTRYPVNWLGFTFWKDTPEKFIAEDYVHEYPGEKNVGVTDEDLSDFVEKLLNQRLPKQKSPWEMYLIENYRSTSDPNNMNPGKRQNQNSALVFNYHHCLTDGNGVSIAFAEHLFEGRRMRPQIVAPPKTGFGQKFLYMLAFPLPGFTEFLRILSYTFTSNPFKIPDSRKEWYQVYAKSDLIPNQLIKNVKNAFGVTYTSVLLSAISAAVHRTDMHTDAEIPMFNVLPENGVTKRKVLENHMTGTIFNLSTVSYKSPVERLKQTNQLFEKSKRSVLPAAIQYSKALSGANLNWVNSFFIKNRMISIALSNNSIVTENVHVKENIKWINTRVLLGGFSGDCGIVVSACSHAANMEICVVAERALMSRRQVQEFASRIKQEIDALGMLIPGEIYEKEK